MAVYVSQPMIRFPGLIILSAIVQMGKTDQSENSFYFLFYHLVIQDYFVTRNSNVRRHSMAQIAQLNVLHQILVHTGIFIVIPKGKNLV